MKAGDSLQFSYREKYKYTPFTKEDIKEIQNVIDYAKGLVIKNSELAQEHETTLSMKNANMYIQARTRTNDRLSEAEIIKIIRDYQETNTYYKDLYDLHQIDYLNSRTAKDYTILKATINSLNREDKNLFEKCYYESLKYHLLVTYTEAFDNQQYHRAYNEMLLIFMTVQRYITYKMDSYFNIDSYDKNKLKNAFISYGLDYFDGFPLNYQRRILKKINQLIQYKGTNIALNDILSIFGFDNIKIYKYLLCKVYDSVAEDKKDLMFYRVPIDDNLDFSKHLPVTYDQIVDNDPFWRSDKKEFLNEPFNILNTKYLSADISMDIVKESLSMSYFLSLLNKMEMNYKSKEEADFKFSNRNISNQPIDLMDAIIALASIALRSHGYKDKIIKNVDSINYVYGFNNINDNVDVRKLLEDIHILLIQNKPRFNESDYDNLEKFIVQFRAKNFETVLESGYEDVETEYNSSIVYKRQLDTISKLSKVENLVYKFYTDNVIEVLDYIKELFIDGKFDPMLFDTYVDIRKIYKMFISVKLSTKDNTMDDFLGAMKKNKTIMDQLDALIKAINLENLTEYYDLYKKNKVGLNDLLKQTMNEITRLRQLNYFDFKSDEERQDYWVRNPRDYKHYPELCNFIELHYISDTLYKNSYSMEEFVKIFKYNNDLRYKLEDIIVESNNYELYRNYLKLWDIKFIGDINISYFSGHDTYSDYLKRKNYDLYAFTQMPATIKGDEKLEYEFYRDKVFELCESIDNHINAGNMNFFVNNGFIGMLDYVKRFIYILIHVFKAYTTQLLETNTVLSFNDKTFNAIRMFDKANISGFFKFREYITLKDFMKTTTTYKFEDRIELRDEIKITTFEAGEED